MSHKAFYQTFYQTEQLFRRADDRLAFPPLVQETVTVADVVEGEAPVPVPAAVRVPVIIDPVRPTPQPVARPAEPIPKPVPEVPAPAPVVSPPVETAPVVAPVAPVVEQPATTPAPPQPAATPVERVPRRPATPLLSQKVLILVDEDLLPSDLLFLEKILKAVHLDIAGVDLLNIHGTQTIDFADVLAGKYIHHFFTFGVPFTRLNLDILMDRYQPVRFDGITFLMADPLPAIEADVALKKKLWEALKKVFLWR